MTQSKQNIYIQTQQEPSIYISYVFNNTTEKYIIDVFNSLNIGKILRIDMKERIDKYDNIYYIVFIHFDYWFDNKNAQELRNALKENKEIKIILDDENKIFWKLYINHQNQQRPHKKITI